MTIHCPVATFICAQIQASGKSQKAIAEEVGFATPNMITMIKQGATKLPPAKIGLMATALNTDPIHLLKLCLSTYSPDTWDAIAPHLEAALTGDEVRLVNAMRDLASGPSIAALSGASKEHLDAFVASLRAPARVH
jgi:transcriptional regulator with XRE-family HTH domain